MNKVVLLVAAVFAATFSNAYASGWDADPWYSEIDADVNVSATEDFDVRKHHAKGWHNSKVCGLELCSGKTATESVTFQGMTTDGAKPPQKGAFDGKYYIKGNFTGF